MNAKITDLDWAKAQLSRTLRPSDLWLVAFLIENFDHDATSAHYVLEVAKDSLT
jgi:hypothetical protein